MSITVLTRIREFIIIFKSGRCKESFENCTEASLIPNICHATAIRDLANECNYTIGTLFTGIYKYSIYKCIGVSIILLVLRFVTYTKAGYDNASV